MAIMAIYKTACSIVAFSSEVKVMAIVAICKTACSIWKEVSPIAVLLVCSCHGENNPSKLPLSLDQLDQSQIPAEQKFEGMPKELVAVLTPPLSEKFNVEGISKELADVLKNQSVRSGCVGVAFSPDGKRAVGGFGDGTIGLWEIGRSIEIASSRKHRLPVSSLFFTPCGKNFLSGSYDHTIRLWNLNGDKLNELACLEGHKGQVWSMALSTDGKMLASGSADETIRLWDLGGDKPREISRVELLRKIAWSVDFSPDGKLLAGTEGDLIHLWDLSYEKPKEKGTFKGHRDSVWRVAFSPDGKTLASSGQDKTVRLWDYEGKELAKLDGHDSTELYGLSFAPEGKSLVSADIDGRIIVWDVQSAKERLRIALPRGLRAISFAPDSRHVAISSEKALIYILRISP